jgi:hypothetical protein
MQIPIIRKANKSAIESTRKELHETLEAVRQAQLQLEQLQKGEIEVGVSILPRPYF